MALQSCPECGKQISSTAGACPNCGYRDFKIAKKVSKGVGTGALIAVTCPIVFIALFLLWETVADMIRYGVGGGSGPANHPVACVFAIVGTVAVAIGIAVWQKHHRKN